MSSHPRCANNNQTPLPSVFGWCEREFTSTCYHGNKALGINRCRRPARYIPCRNSQARVCVCVSRLKFSASALEIQLKVCGCQPRGGKRTNRNVAAVSSKRGGAGSRGCREGSGRPLCSCVCLSRGRQAGRQADLTDGCEKGCGGRCIGNREPDDQMHY